MPDTCRVFQLKVETSCIAQFRDGRRGEGKDSRLLDAGEISHGATGNGTDLLRRFRPQAPVLQLDEHHRRILATTGKVEASYRENGFDIRSEEHTSELQSLMRNSYAVFCLKKKNNIYASHYA